MSRRAKLEQMLQVEPNDVFLHYALACELAKDADTAATEAAFQRIHQQFPDYVPAWFRHAQWLGEQGEPTARTVGEQALEVARRMGDFHAAGEISSFLSMLD